MLKINAKITSWLGEINDVAEIRMLSAMGIQSIYECWREVPLLWSLGDKFCIVGNVFEGS